MKKVPTLLAALMLSAGIAGIAHADAFTDQVVADLQSKGYTHIEIKIFETTVKAEAINGSTKLEVTYDRATGDILKTETDRVEPGEDTTPGVEIDDRTGEDDNSGHSDDDEDEDEDDDHSGHGDGDDGDDDDEDDDHSGHGGGDDDGEDDDSDDDNDEDEDDHENDPNHD